MFSFYRSPFFFRISCKYSPHLICLKGFTNTNNFLMAKPYHSWYLIADHFNACTIWPTVCFWFQSCCYSFFTNWSTPKSARFQLGAGGSKNKARPVVIQIWCAVWGLNFFTINSHVSTYSIIKTRKIWVTILKPFIELHSIISGISFTICS